MKVVILLVVLLALCGVALGGYMLFKQPEIMSGIVSPSSSPSKSDAVSDSRGASAGEMLELREEIGLLREKYERHVERLETEVGQQAVEIDNLKKQLAAVHAAKPATVGEAGAISPPAQATPLSLQDTDRETLKELLGELSEERRRDELQKREERVREELSRARQRQIDSLAEKYKWDEQKKQQVIGLLAQQGEKIEELRKTVRSDEASPESREQLQAQMRKVREDTQKALEDLLTEEELQELQRATRPARRERAPGRRSRFPSGRQPGEEGG